MPRNPFLSITYIVHLATQKPNALNLLAQWRSLQILKDSFKFDVREECESTLHMSGYNPLVTLLFYLLKFLVIIFISCGEVFYKSFQYYSLGLGKKKRGWGILLFHLTFCF